MTYDEVEAAFHAKLLDTVGGGKVSLFDLKQQCNATHPDVEQVRWAVTGVVNGLKRRAGVGGAD
ncbi:hypothetical protein AB0C10_15905 [Microbispora amethystogenes]|uniref:hypothetical protein n=1 Tax=Microbispora amethystogenes TaxID=1427754 RepID=UPI0033F7B3DD